MKNLYLLLPSFILLFIPLVIAISSYHPTNENVLYEMIKNANKNENDLKTIMNI